MAPHLRLEDWARLYQPDGLMRLYRSTDLQSGRRSCDTQDAVSALATLVSTPGTWSLWWAAGDGEGEVDWIEIASSDSRRHWYRLLCPDVADAHIEARCVDLDSRPNTTYWGF
jgi:hypothetical protein